MAEAAERIKLDPRSLNEAVHPRNLAHTDSKAVTPISPAAQKFHLLIRCNLLKGAFKRWTVNKLRHFHTGKKPVQYRFAIGRVLSRVPRHEVDYMHPTLLKYLPR
jgi:hypothetical protein